MIYGISLNIIEIFCVFLYIDWNSESFDYENTELFSRDAPFKTDQIFFVGIIFQILKFSIIVY